LSKLPSKASCACDLHYKCQESVSLYRMYSQSPWRANARLVSQLVALERRTARSGKDSVDHYGGHDDAANAAAGALVLVAAGSGVLGLVELMKGVDAGTIQLDPMARYNAPPGPNAKPVSVETRACQCGGVMREHPASRGTFVCAGCGHAVTISSVLEKPASRGDYLRDGCHPLLEFKSVRVYAFRFVHFPYSLNSFLGPHQGLCCQRGVSRIHAVVCDGPLIQRYLSFMQRWGLRQ
jgi:hypothetical protein